MEIKLLKLADGRYNLCDNLYFAGAITIDKKSALEITHTLLDSLNMLDKDAEELLYKIEEAINKNN